MTVRVQQKAPRLRNVRGVGLAASWAIGWSVVAEFVSVVLEWRAVGAVPTEEVTAADWGMLVVGVIYLVASVVAGVFFIVWLARARENPEFLCDAKHYYARVWVGLGWFVPICAFWVPGRVVQNVAAASDPRTAVRNAWIDSTRDSTVSMWWGFWIVSSVASVIGLRTSGSPGASALFSTVSVATGVVAAVMAVRLIRMINERQSSRPPVPWWQLPA